MDALKTIVLFALTAVAEIGFGEGPSSIDRYDRVRRAAIGADLKRGFELGTAPPCRWPCSPGC